MNYKKQYLLTIFISVLFIIITTSLVIAQNGGILKGKIFDSESGEPLPGVQINITGTPLYGLTDTSGQYLILNIPVGVYQVEIEYEGYQSVLFEQVRILTNLSTNLSLNLEPTQFELYEPIPVNFDRTLTHPDQTGYVEIRTAEEIATLPRRSLSSIVTLTPGFKVIKGSLHVRGGHWDETAYLYDGTIQNEMFYGSNDVHINTTSIEELQVHPGYFNAEYGGYMSGLVQVATKSGSPQYHFTAEAITDEFLSRDKETFGAYSYAYNDYSLSFSGPIWPKYKKITFFTTYQRLYMGDKDPRLNWADGKTYTFVDPFHIPVYDAQDSLIAIRNDTLSTTLNSNIKPGNWKEQHHMMAKLRFQPTNHHFQFLLSAFLNSSKYQNTNSSTYNRSPVSNMLTNSEHSPRTEHDVKSFQLNFTHTLNSSTFYSLKLNYYNSFWEKGDGQFFNDLFAYGDPERNPYLPIDEETGEIVPGVPLNNTIARAWTGRGYLYNSYTKKKQIRYGAKFDLTWQQKKNHQIKLGAEFYTHTLRFYNLSGYPGVVGLAEFKDRTDLTEEEWYQIYTIRTSADYYGYDFRGNEAGKGDWFRKPDGSFDIGRPEEPKHPQIGAVYIQDQITSHDLILNFGLRLDYFNANTWQFKDPYHPLSAGGDPNRFDAEDVKNTDSHTNLSPRLGAAYNPLESTIIFVNYGKFYQIPRGVDLYSSKNYTDIMLSIAPYYDNLGFSNLKPSETLAFEGGIKQGFGSHTALSFTGFYKISKDHVIGQNFSTDIQDVGFIQNRVEGKVFGFEISLKLRRFHNIAISGNYSYSDALSDGSYSNTLRNITWLQADYPKMDFPADYDQRHAFNMNLDYRLGEKKGPALGKFKPFENFGINLLLTFNSGYPYTSMRVVSEPFWGGGTGERPTSRINAYRTPSNSYVDLKIDKYFNLPIARIRLNVSLWILNLFNTENVVEVYPYTGEADYNGWLDTPDGRQWQEYAEPWEIELYKKRSKNPFYYGRPRQIMLGLRLEI
jgi:hypothetical protein